ncbi:hypothetical protein ATO6_19160 [Oceanicola sp. 22II-s10i]|uniref:hypothetical protein n=1 Tax=Oceanicola sp. 22II-s10i TaxID=1317116 RepID=UPI000B52659C|nr:hypothetical protein [Oceanicola sp. 22II-s10i]OWU83262.1 hypothetical protein ATO6_19160 [Oceanicola sp. 22II-s10i]
MDDTEVVARIEASGARRVFGLVMLSGLGAMVLWLGLAGPGGAVPVRIGMAVLGLLVLWVAVVMHRASADSLELTETELRTGSGLVIARVAEIETVDRGLFAFRPSNGFVLRLSEKKPRLWAPGLYWRFGRRVGIGGVAHAAECRAMADALSVMLVKRNTGL